MSIQFNADQILAMSDEDISLLLHNYLMNGDMENYNHVSMINRNNHIARFNRKKEYPSIGEFADAMYWASKGDNTKLDTYYAACEAVKLKYPKAQ